MKSHRPEVIAVRQQSVAALGMEIHLIETVDG